MGLYSRWGKVGARAVKCSSFKYFVNLKMELPFPRDICAHITRYNCYRPTPSAKALNQYFDLHPWINPMIEEFPYMHPCHIILRAPTLGLEPCPKCPSCYRARLHYIRGAADPE